jgi:hypothetical protein
MYSILRIESVHSSCAQFFLYLTHLILFRWLTLLSWSWMRTDGCTQSASTGGFFFHFVGCYERCRLSHSSLLRGMGIRGDGSYSVPNAHDCPSTLSTPGVSHLGDRGYGSPPFSHLGDCHHEGVRPESWQKTLCSENRIKSTLLA